VKTEFGKFGDVLDRLKRQINAASNTIDQSQVRTRAMERRLRSVEALPAEQAEATLALPESEEAGEEDREDRGAADDIEADDDKDRLPS